MKRKKIEAKDIWNKFGMVKVKVNGDREIMKGSVKINGGMINFYSDIDGKNFTAQIVLEGKRKGIFVKNTREWERIKSLILYLDKKGFTNVLRIFEELNNDNSNDNINIDFEF